VCARACDEVKCRIGVKQAVIVPRLGRLCTCQETPPINLFSNLTTASLFRVPKQNGGFFRTNGW
jgi:hypothetical protein